NEIAFLKESHEKAMILFKKVKRDGKPTDVIQQCLEILKPEDVRSEFEVLFRNFAKSMDMLMPDPCVDPFLKDFKFLGMIREGARNLYRDDRLSLVNCSKKVENLIHAHIKDAGVEEILTPINITAPDFEEKLEIKGSTKAKASHVEHAIRETISAKIGEDPAFYESLKDRLESLIEADRKRRKDEAELLKGLVEISKQEERRDLIAKEKDLLPDEFAFYGLLGNYKDELFGENDEKTCLVTKDIVSIIKNKMVIDWIEKEDIQKEMRRNIKDILRKIG
ncbi:unnamed protein product, partial [marine sediment metagenome]